MEVDVRLPSMCLPFSYSEQDICSVIENKALPNSLIFFPPKYTLDDEGRDKLYTDLQLAALAGGDSLTLWGRGCGKHQVMYIRCQCAIIYRGNKVDKETGSIIDRSDYRNSTYSNDRKNQRHGQKGRNASHRTASERRLTKHDDRCCFSLAVYKGDTSYYMKSSNATGLHQFHPRRDHLRTSTSLLLDEEVQLQEDMNSARAKMGSAAHLHYVRSARQGTPTLLSRHQIAHLCKKKSKADENGKEGHSEDGETDDIYKFLEESGNYYVSLLARGSKEEPTSSKDESSKGTLFNESRIGNITGQEDLEVAGTDDHDMLQIVQSHRRELKIDDSKEMMVGIAYGMPFELEQFGLFHVSMHIDATADTNKEGRPFVTVTSKDSYGRMFFVLRAFLPSEQSWAYKWLFQTVFPVLLGKEVLNKLSIVVTDGDSQEITQLEDSVNKFFPGVYRMRCSWHIIDRGWHKKVKVSLGGHSHRKRPLHLRGKKRQTMQPPTELNKTARTIYRWVFSWAQPSYCETEEEYLVSKALFMIFVQSNQVKDLFGSIFVDSVVTFVRENVFPHEDRFCYYKRHALFHLETHTNCGHEGTNNGVKHCSSPVMPQNRLDRAIKTLNLNAEIKALNTNIMVCHKTNRRKLWSESPTSAYVTDPCESMLKTEWIAASDWIPHRVSKYRWLLIHRLEKVTSILGDWSDDGEDDVDASDEDDIYTSANPDAQKRSFGPIPRFSRVREVSVSVDTKVFHCTCRSQERMGMPCRHIASVCRSNVSILGKDPTGFPLSAVRVFWWNQYYLYGLSNKKDHQKTKQALMALAEDDTKGLPCPGRLDCPPSFSCPEHIFESFYKPATDRLLNYKSYDAIGALQAMRDRNNHRLFNDDVPAGMSQVSFLPGLDDDDNNWSHAMEELSDTEDYRDSRRVLSRHYNELSEAFNNSKAKESLEVEFKTIMNDFIVRARGSAAVPSTSKGNRVSMLPASSKRRKTHGTNHY